MFPYHLVLSIRYFFLIFYTILILNSFKSLSEEIPYVEYMKQINNNSLANNRFLSNEALCYDKIMHANTIYNINHVLATFYENAFAAYIIKKNCVCKQKQRICYL
jgi:hypothetical protein